MKFPQVVQDLLAARELIATRGWARGFGTTGEPRCAVGALDEVTNADHERMARSEDLLAAVIDAEHRNDGSTGGNIGEWNDRARRRKAHVLDAFDAAASLALSEAEVAR